jgi:hypothetical protein
METISEANTREASFWIIRTLASKSSRRDVRVSSDWSPTNENHRRSVYARSHRTLRFSKAGSQLALVVGGVKQLPSAEQIGQVPSTSWAQHRCRQVLDSHIACSPLLAAASHTRPSFSLSPNLQYLQCWDMVYKEVCGKMRQARPRCMLP